MSHVNLSSRSVVITDGPCPADCTPITTEAEGLALLAALEPLPEPAPAPHRVLKDTILLRVKAKGKLPALRAAVNGLDDDQRFEWDQSSWFSSDNALVRTGLTAIGLDADEILADDPLAP